MNPIPPFNPREKDWIKILIIAAFCIGPASEAVNGYYENMRQKQRLKFKESWKRIDQQNSIRQKYLDRLFGGEIQGALKQVQLFRFLSHLGTDTSLQNWARQELKIAEQTLKSSNEVIAKEKPKIPSLQKKAATETNPALKQNIELQIAETKQNIIEAERKINGSPENSDRSSSREPFQPSDLCVIVKNAENIPIPDVTVVLTNSINYNKTTIVTDKNGRGCVQKLFPTSYYVVIDHPGYNKYQSTKTVMGQLEMNILNAPLTRPFN